MNHFNAMDAATCWQCVLNRDQSADGTFVYGVLSTRIFCRPSCPARRPKREGTRFFASPCEAKNAGFRACERCRPESLRRAEVERVQLACRIIEASEEVLGLEELAKRVGVSPHHLQRTFAKITGISPRDYGEALRLGRVKTKLSEGETITNALYDAGFGSARGLYQRAPSQLGMTPATHGRGGLGAQIRFCVAPCELGFVLVASTPSGVCSVQLGDVAAELERALQSEFFAASIERDDMGLTPQLARILELLSGKSPHFDLPLDVRATAFQWRVWCELTAIARGQTRSYSQIAAAIEQPTATRAVARACATNPVALVVPCHRVVRESGELAGYRWGLERKKRLLELEGE